MIDISLWRASIGLWYYQICDNVIDKSLPALCRKGTRAKKQSSNEKHSQTNRNSTAVEQISSNEIPQYRANRRNRYSNPVVSNGQTPVLSFDSQKPVALSNGQKPVALSNGQKPVALSNGQKTVALSNGQKSVALSNGQKPEALSNSQKPILSTNGQKPVVPFNNQEPVASTNGQTPVVSMNSQKPVALSNDQKPVLFTDSQTPVVLFNSNTANTTMRYADWCGRVQTISLAVFLFLLLILSGDIELNPGPKTGK